MPVLRVLLLVAALVPASMATRTQPARVAEESGISGYVLAPDGTPVSGGTVAIQAPGARTTASIDRTGRFRIVPNSPGVNQLIVGVPGLAPYRVNVTVPPSRTLKLPAIRLSLATYFRARFVSPAGEPITSLNLRRESVDATGARIPDPPDARDLDRIDGDGTLTIGPLPRGITMLAVRPPFFAQTRLPDLFVAGEAELLDGGTVVLQPGAVVHVDVVDATGAPVPQREVWLEDIAPFSQLFFPPVRTDEAGRATFDRVGPGRYRVRTMSAAGCSTQPLSIARVVSVSGRGTVRERIVIDGTATFRVTSPLGPLRGIQVWGSTDSADSAPPAWLRSRGRVSPLVMRAMGRSVVGTSCTGGTDDEGRVTLAHFPPGPARIAVRLVYSTYVRPVQVAGDGREIVIAIPDGFVPLRVVTPPKNAPLARAAVTWTGGGGRVEATTSANGETLLEGAGTTGGTLAIAAEGYQRVELQLAEPPATLHEVALVPEPTANLSARVVTETGEPLPRAVVELTPANPMEIPHVAMTDARGFVTFPDVPPGGLRLTAAADGFVTARMAIAGDRRTGIVMTLTKEPSGVEHSHR